VGAQEFDADCGRVITRGSDPIETRRAAVAERYRAGTRGDELRATTGWHRKHALRALRSAGLPAAALERCDLMAVMIVPPLGYHDTSI